jgi:hypothetical protein
MSSDEDFSLDDLVRRSVVYHRIASKFLTTLLAVQITLRIVLKDHVFVALHQFATPFFAVPVKL